MIISHKHKFIFLKTRKTAGSTFEKLVFPLLGEKDICSGSTRDGTPALNLPPDTNGHAVPKPIDGYYFFSIERNPWDKVVSSYYWHQHIKPKQFGNMEFEEYVMTCPLLPTDWDNYQKCNMVYKYEEMEHMYMTLRYHLGLDIDLDLMYTTRVKSQTRKVEDYREVHTPKTKNYVSKVFKREIERFDYEF